MESSSKNKINIYMSALPEYKGSPQVWTLVYVFYINNSCIGLHSG